MTALAWPAVALVLGLVFLWRLDVFSRQWKLGSDLAARVSALELTVANALREKAPAAELAAVKESLARLTARLGPPK